MGKVKTGPIITGVYKITNLLSGKFYIGQSIDVNYRFYEHQIGTGHCHKSVIDAANSLGLHDIEPICNCCNGTQSLGHGYIWSNVKYNTIPENYIEINKQTLKGIDNN